MNLSKIKRILCFMMTLIMILSSVTNLTFADSVKLNETLVLKPDWLRSYDGNVSKQEFVNNGGVMVDAFGSVNGVNAVLKWDWNSIKNLKVNDTTVVWNAGKVNYGGNPIQNGLSAATWNNYGQNWGGQASFRRFQGTFEFPQGFSPKDKIAIKSVNDSYYKPIYDYIKGTSYDGGTVFPINDDMYVFVYKESDKNLINNSNYLDYLAFWTGTSGKGVWSSPNLTGADWGYVSPLQYNGKQSVRAFHGVYPNNITAANQKGQVVPMPADVSKYLSHTDTWYTVTSSDNIGGIIYDNYKGNVLPGEKFIIDIIANDNSGNGGMDEFQLLFTKTSEYTVNVNYFLNEVGNADSSNPNFKGHTILKDVEWGNKVTLEQGTSDNQLNKFWQEGYGDGVQQGEYIVEEEEGVINVVYKKAPVLSKTAEWDGLNGDAVITLKAVTGILGFRDAVITDFINYDNFDVDVDKLNALNQNGVTFYSETNKVIWNIGNLGNAQEIKIPIKLNQASINAEGKYYTNLDKGLNLSDSHQKRAVLTYNEGKVYAVSPSLTWGSYIEKHYKEQLDGSYIIQDEIADQKTLYGPVGKTVTATTMNFENYTENIDGTLPSGYERKVEGQVVEKKSGSEGLVLKRYYNLNTHNITVNAVNGTVTPLPEPVKHGADSQKITFSPNPGYKLERITIDKVTIFDADTGLSENENVDIKNENGLTEVIFKEVKCNHEIEVVYAKRTDIGYTVNYYNDSISSDTSNYLGSQNGQGEFKKELSLDNIKAELGEDLLEKFAPIGYAKPGEADKDKLVLGSINASENVINIVYKKDNFDYTVNYYKNSIDNNNLVTSVQGNADYGSKIGYETEISMLPNDVSLGEGYTKNGVATGQFTVTENKENNILNVVFSIDTFKVTGEITEGGNIKLPKDNVNYGGSASVTWEPAKYHEVIKVEVNGVEVDFNSDNKLDLDGIKEDIHVKVTTMLRTSDDLLVEEYEDNYDGDAHGVKVLNPIEGDKLYYSLDNENWVEEITYTDFTNGPIKVYIKAENDKYPDRTAESYISILKLPVKVTAGSVQKHFNGQEQNIDEKAYEYTKILDGQTLSAVARGTGKNVGKYNTTVDEVAIKDKNENIVTDNYQIEYVDGVLEITDEAAYGYIVNYYLGSVNSDNKIGTDAGNAVFGQTIGSSDNSEIKLELNKYLPDQERAGAYKDGYITADSIKSIGECENIINVVYEPNIAKVTVEMVDQDGKIIEGVFAEAEGQTTLTIEKDLTLVAPEGYVIVTKPNLPTEYPAKDTNYRYVAVKLTAEISDFSVLSALYETEYNSGSYEEDKDSAHIENGKMTEEVAKTYSVKLAKDGFTYNNDKFLADSEIITEKVIIKVPVTTGSSIGGEVTTGSSIGGEVTTGSSISNSTVEFKEEEVEVSFTKWIYKLFFDKDYVEDPKPPIDPEDPKPPVDPEDPKPPVDPEDPNPPVDPEDPNPPVDPEDPQPPVDNEEDIGLEEEEIPGGAIEEEVIELPDEIIPGGSIDDEITIEDDTIPGGEIPNTGNNFTATYVFSIISLIALAIAFLKRKARA